LEIEFPEIIMCQNFAH